MTTPTTTPEPAREKTGIPKNPGRRDLGLRATLALPRPRDRREVLRPDHLHGLPDVLLRAGPGRDLPARASTATSTRSRCRSSSARVIESGHGSTIEHVVFTFAISGVSRTLSHQLVRHRAGVAFDQQSQRYVKFKGAATMLPHSIAEGDPDLRERYEEQVDGALGLYGELLGAGVPGEDARFVFPNATRTNLVMTTNLRALIHMSGLRLCTMAQWEIRRLFQLIRHEIFAVSPFLGLVPGARSACRSATATRSTTATATARSGRTRTRSWRPGRRRRRQPRRPAGSCRVSRRARSRSADPRRSGG